jgi:glycosyl transferase family 25
MFALLIVLLFTFIYILLKYFKVIEKYEKNIPIYVISLKTSQDRRKKIQDMLNGQVNFNFYDAVDGKEMSKKDIELSNKVFKKDSLNPGQRGCFLSHLKLYEKIKKEKIKNTLILEDDASIDNFYYLKNLDKFLIDDYDIIFLGHCAENEGEFVKETFTIRKSVSPRCTHAYIISEKGANKLIDYFYSQKWDLPIDELIYRHDLNKYSLFPVLMKQNGMNSTINV